MGSCLISLVIILFVSSVSGLTTYECTDTTGSVIPFEIPIPGHRIAITSPNYPNTFNLTRLDCKWSFKALHGAKIKVQLVDSDLNDGCNDNILNVVDDTPTAGRSRFKHPGKSAKCGMNDFESVAAAYEASGDIVTVTFKSLKNTGHATFKLLVTSFVARKRRVCPESTPDWSGCPAGPCCAGSDCCVFKPGKTAQEIEIPEGSTPGLDCQYKLVAKKGTQIAVNFLEMDIHADENQDCLTDYLKMEEADTCASSMIGKEGLTFCGQRLPNYPGPSVVVSGGSSVYLKYHTDKSTAKKGTGFKAKVSAINPICNELSFEYRYGEEVCKSTCEVTWGKNRTRSSVKPQPLTTTPLPTTTPSPVPVPSVNETCEEHDVDYLGNDIQCLKNSGKSWEGCAKTCKTREKCTHWTWLSEDFVGSPDMTNTCCIKTSNGGRTKRKGAVSGSKVCACEEMDIDLAGNDIDSALDVATWEQCAHICKQRSDCSFWTWVSDDYVIDEDIIHKCHLKNGDSGRTSAKGLISGNSTCGEWSPPVKTTPEPELINKNCSTTGSKLISSEDSINLEDVQTWEQCAILCAAVDTCSNWNFYLDQISYITTECSLLTSVDSDEASAGYVSGTKECGKAVSTTTTTTTTPQPTRPGEVTTPQITMPWDTTTPGPTTPWEGTGTTVPGESTTTESEEEEEERCNILKMTIQVINAETGGPLPRATVRIESKRVSRSLDIRAIKATHITDANGEVAEVGTLKGTYSFKVYMQNGSDIFRTQVDRTIGNATCVNDACTECSLRMKVLAEKEPVQEPTVEPCTCKGHVTIVNANTQQPIPGACVTFTVESPDTDDTSTSATDEDEETARVIPTYAPTDLASDVSPVSTENEDRNDEIAISRSIIINPSDRVDSNCKDDWCKFEGTGSLFRYFESTATWQEAHDRCRVFGAHLASIPSMNVNNFVVSIVSEPDDGGYWIGGTQKDGQWVWGDASPWNYANWAEGEPNSNNENCVELKKDLSFNDVDCNSRRRFICKKKDVPKASTCELQTDVDGNIDIETYRAGKYVLTVSHEEYNSAVLTTELLLGITDGKCEKCNTEIRWELEKEFCNKTTNPVNLKITVVNKETSDVIEGVELTTYISEGANTTSTTTNVKGTSLVTITEDGDYTITATAEGLQPVSIKKNIACDPKDCGNCKPVVTLYMSSPPQDSTIPPTNETCTTKIENSLTVLPVDNSNDKPIPNAEISIIYNKEFIANKVGLTNSTYKTEITENGLYIVNGTADGYVPKEANITTNCGSCQENDIDLMGNDIKFFLNIATWAECAELCKEDSSCSHWTWVSQSYTEDPSIFNKCHLKNSDSGRVMTSGLISGGEDCDKTNCHNCINVIKLYMDPDACEETEFKVSVFEAVTRTPIQGATVRITDVSEDSPQVISNHLVCPTTDIEPCGWKDISEEDCGKKGCCARTETCEQLDIDFVGNDIGFVYNVSSWDECAKICKEKEGCSYWTWVSARFTQDTTILNKCHLKNLNNGGVETTGLISGGADCDNTKCFKKVESKPMKTDANGMIIAPSPGEAKLKIEVEKEGYEFMNGTADVFCQHPCDTCNPSFTAIVKEKLCEGEDMIDMQVTVMDKEKNPIKEATVTLKLTSSAAGATSGNTSEVMRTDSSGQVDPPILASGTYIVTTSAKGFVTKTEEVIVDKSKACEEQHIPIKLILNKLREEDHCEESKISIFVFDETTKLGLPGTKVTLTSDDEVVAKDETDAAGAAAIPVSENGKYTVSVVKDGFTEKISTTTIQYPDSCNATLELGINEKTCASTIMPVVIINNATLTPIPNALVRVILTKSKAGSSITTVDKPKYTDENGTATFKTPMNGEYKVSVTVEGFDPIEVTEDLMCDTDNCAGCAPVVTIHTPPTYCQDKSLKLIVMDCKTNARVADANIVTTIETTRGQIKGSEVSTSKTGEILIPITENGMYNSIITLDGYLTMRNSFEVAISMDDCDVFAPIDIIPLCPPVDPGCTEVSLSWTNDNDIDLEAYRVNILNTNDTCNTKPSCCESCKKEECEGVIETIDNDEGTSGTETITYCKTNDYSNMIFVSDPTGKGNNLPNSGAKIVITHGENEQIIRIDETQQTTGSKYWLAGCLTTDDNSFNFINLNKFTEEKPSLENPLYCYDRANIEKKTREDTTLENAKIIVNIFDAETNAPISGAIAEASTVKESISRVSNAAGTTSIKVTKSGDYNVEVSAKGYVIAKTSITLDCNPEKEECENTVSFSLLPAGKTDKIEIVLNWGEKASNLDLHTMQINKEAPGAGCETFFNKMVGCENTQLDADKFNGGADGGEKITISNPSENLKYTYMIFVKDNSADTDELETSEAHIDISDGTKSLTKTLPKYTSTTPSGANFWFVGCVRTVGESYEFAAVDTLSRDSPYLTQKLFCDNLFKTDSNAGLEETAEFCEDIKATVRLQSQQPSAYSSSLNPAMLCPTCRISSVQIVSVRKDAQKTIFECVPGGVPGVSGVPGVPGGVPGGESGGCPGGYVDTVTVPITSNGQYLVKVEGDGYVATEQVFDVACDITKCRSCKPLFVMPLSWTLGSDEARIMLSWADLPNTLQLSSLERGCEETDTDLVGDDIEQVLEVESSQACSQLCQNRKDCSHWTWVNEKYVKNPEILHKCFLKNGDSGRTKEIGLVSGKGGCVDYKPDPTTTSKKVSNFWSTSILLSGVSTYMKGKIGMIFVENLSQFPKFTAKTNVVVTITDGSTTSKNRMDLTNYGGQNFWIAGCYKVDNGTINFSPEASFLNSRPDEEVPDYCLRFYGA